MTTTTLSERSPEELLSALLGHVFRYDVKLKDLEPGRQLLAASPDEQRRFVMATLARMPAEYEGSSSWWRITDAISTLLRRALPFEHDDIITLAEAARELRYGWHIEAHMPAVIGRYLAGHPRTPALDAALAALIAELEGRAWGVDAQRRLQRLRALAGIVEENIPLPPGDVWSDAVIAEIGELPADMRDAWAELLRDGAGASGSAPSGRWLKAARALVERIGAEAFRAAMMRWLPLVERPRPAAVLEHWGGERPAHLLQDANADALRGLVWLCGTYGDRELARALGQLAACSYRKLPGIGARCPRVGNAAVWALGQLAAHDGLAQLALLRARVRLPNAQKAIDSALRSAAALAGLAPDALEELLVPTYGLEEVGLRREPLGDVMAELRVAGGGVELRFERADGKRLASAPRAVRAQHADALKELTQASADIRQMLPAQRDRIERLYLQQKTWSLAEWRARYLDHPLVGTLARRLIWSFGKERAAGIWHEGRLVDVEGRPLDQLADDAPVALWHPLDGGTEQTLAWRGWLAAHEVQQPFKQAHREIYLLTDAERNTHTYSNRFAAHILRQHQFNALCAARGWKNSLRLMVDDSYPPAQRLLPQWGLRAEYWVEGAGGEYGRDTNNTGTFLYLATDQVRFYALDAAQHYAHAGGGGYHAHRWGAASADPLPLDQVPALVFSEILRDVDLFVGVASVGNDPAWGDGGSEGRYRDYWTSYAFGELSATAATRREVLARLVPRLAIAGRCQLSERFLVVRGDLRTYKIHLGSGNILMEPDDQYLCIVPARGAAPATADGARFVPFEGDGTLAIILSKALLLANDTAIDDPTITRQIRR
jgi:hypothetical protein